MECNSDRKLPNDPDVIDEQLAPTPASTFNMLPLLQTTQQLSLTAKNQQDSKNEDDDDFDDYESAREELLDQFLKRYDQSDEDIVADDDEIIELVNEVCRTVDRIIEDRRQLDKLMRQKQHSSLSSGHKQVREKSKFNFGPQYETDSVQTGSGPTPFTEFENPTEIIRDRWKIQWLKHHQSLTSPCETCKPISK